MHEHAATGDLSGANAIIVGAASRQAGGVEHSTSGNLVGSGSQIIGDADHQQVFIPQTTGGISPKVKTKIQKNQREEIEALVREAFDKLDGTYVPPVVVNEVKQEVRKEIRQIDFQQYDVAISAVNSLLLQAKQRLQEYDDEMDDEEALMMLL